LTCLSCRKPETAAPKPNPAEVEAAEVHGIPGEHLTNPPASLGHPTSDDKNGRESAVDDPTNPMAQGDKKPGEPVAGKAVATPPTEAVPAAKTSEGLQAAASKAATDDSTNPMAQGVKKPGEPLAAGGKAVATPPAEAVPAAKTSEGLQAAASKAAMLDALERVAKADREQDEAVVAEGAVMPPPIQAAIAAKASEGMRAVASNPAPLVPQGAKSAVGPEGKAAVIPTTPLPLTKPAEGSRAISENPADQAALALVARGDKDWTVRMAAVEALIGQAILAQIATSDEDSDIRKLAVSLLTDQAGLARVARSDKDWTVRSLAVGKLTGRADLAQIALNDQDSDIRKLAVSKLSNQAGTP